jgi:hypothetical protein
MEKQSVKKADILRHKTITVHGDGTHTAHTKKERGGNSVSSGDKNNRRGRSGETKGEFGPFDI